MPICGARTRNCRKCGHHFPKEEYELTECPECGESRLCQKPVKREGERCRLHGGASPKGVMSPHFVHGMYSKYLPDRLAERYEEAVADEELLNLRSDIALLHARLTEILGRLDATAGADLWLELRDSFASLRAAMQKQDPRATRRALTNLEGLISKGAEEAGVWNEAYDIVERRRKLIESERKRLVDMHQMISAEKALAMIANIQSIIRKHVSDERTLSAISTALRELSLRSSQR